MLWWLFSSKIIPLSISFFNIYNLEIAMVNNIANHNNMNHSTVKSQAVMGNNITSHNNMNNSSVKPETVLVNNITTPVSNIKQYWSTI
jgi:hypothetical protein